MQTIAEPELQLIYYPKCTKHNDGVQLGAGLPCCRFLVAFVLFNKQNAKASDKSSILFCELQRTHNW